MSPKEKNRYKEIKRINSRIKELEVEVKIFNNSIHSEHIKKLKSAGGKVSTKEFNYSSEKNGKFLSVEKLRNLIKKNLSS